MIKETASDLSKYHSVFCSSRYELRVIVWNTEHIPATETNIVTGVRSSDIYVKGYVGLYSITSNTLLLLESIK